MSFLLAFDDWSDWWHALVIILHWVCVEVEDMGVCLCGVSSFVITVIEVDAQPILIRIRKHHVLVIICTCTLPGTTSYSTYVRTYVRSTVVSDHKAASIAYIIVLVY
jgi:hypothetical protein